MTTRVLVLGGGFAGVIAARTLVDRLGNEGRLRRPGRRGPRRRGVEVVLANRENYFVFQPLLADVLPGAINPTHSVVPLRRMLPDVDVEVAVVEGVDADRRRVLLRRRHDTSSFELEYDELVLALGSVTDFRSVPGMAEHALGIRTLGDAIYLRNHVLAMLEEADLETDARARQALLTFVVVGGGSTGVEVAAQLNELVRGAARSFRERRLEPRVVLVHSRSRVLPTFGDRLGWHATRVLARSGVRLALERRLTRVDADRIVLDDGTTVATRTVVSTVGNAPHPVLRGLPAGVDGGGWLTTTPSLEVPGLAGTWAIGDCASVPHPETGEPAPATAQHAVRQGQHVADNILASLDGEAPSPYHYHEKGMLVSLGMLRGVGSVLGMRISGPPAWLLWRGYYLSQLPTLDRRVRVGLDWLTDLVLPRDTVQIDLRRSTTRPDVPGAMAGGQAALELVGVGADR